jgi:Protein of unknown function (DUF3631)
LTDRQKDGARILLVIADAAGGDWPTRSRAVLCELYGARPAEDGSIGIQLLADLRIIFDELTDKAASADLLEKLTEIETSPWADWNRGKPMTAVGLSRLLKPFRIFPKTIRIGAGTSKGYERTQFEDTWSRYLPKTSPCSPSPPFPAVTPSQANIHAGSPPFSTRNTIPPVTGSKSEESPVSTRVVTAVTDQKGGEGAPGEEEDQESLWADVTV